MGSQKKNLLLQHTQNWVSNSVYTRGVNQSATCPPFTRTLNRKKKQLGPQLIADHVIEAWARREELGCSARCWVVAPGEELLGTTEH